MAPSCSYWIICPSAIWETDKWVWGVTSPTSLQKSSSETLMAQDTPFLFFFICSYLHLHILFYCLAFFVYAFLLTITIPTLLNIDWIRGFFLFFLSNTLRLMQGFQHNPNILIKYSNLIRLMNLWIWFFFNMFKTINTFNIAYIIFFFKWHRKLAVIILLFLACRNGGTHCDKPCCGGRPLTWIWLPSVTTTYSCGINSGTPSCEMMYWIWREEQWGAIQRGLPYRHIETGSGCANETPRSPGCLRSSAAGRSVRRRWLCAGCRCLPPGIKARDSER